MRSTRALSKVEPDRNHGLLRTRLIIIAIHEAFEGVSHLTLHLTRLAIASRVFPGRQSFAFQRSLSMASMRLSQLPDYPQLSWKGSNRC